MAHFRLPPNPRVRPVKHHVSSPAPLTLGGSPPLGDPLSLHQSDANRPDPAHGTGSQALRLSIYRYTPEISETPRLNVYDLGGETWGPMVLDALLAIKDRLNPFLTFRRSYREGVCGSCAL